MARLIKRPRFVWEQSRDEELRDLVLKEGLTAPQIARKLDKDLALIKKELRRLRLLKLATKAKAGSGPQRNLEDIVRQIFPNTVVKSEVHLADRLFLDIWVPQHKIGYEYQGRQHDELIEFFHQDRDDFRRQLERDQKKRNLCEEHGITLIVVRWDEPLTVDHIHQRTMGALSSNVGD